MAIELVNGSKVYQINGDKVAETAEYRVYICTQVDTGRRFLLQVATSVEHNGGLDRAAYVLRELKRKADEIEKEYAKVQKGEEHLLLNYDLAFPELVDTFVCVEQGRRRVNILAFRGVDDVSLMVPLVNIATKHRLRVDLRSSVWLMGKLLKLLVFTHSEGFAVNLVNGHNVLLEKDKHYVLIFDWSCTKAFVPGEVPALLRRHDIAEAARAVITAMGGDPKTGVFPADAEEFAEYCEFLRRLAKGGVSDAKKAHKEFYKLADDRWPRKYYPFTTKPLT